MPRPTDQDLVSLKWLLTRLDSSEEYCRPYFERAKRHYKLYRFGSAVNAKDWPYVNRVRSRDILAFIEDSTALMIQTLFATMPFISVIPRDTGLMYMNYTGIDSMKIGDQVARCLDYQISHEGTEFFEEIIDYFKGGCIYGNSYMGVYPKFEADGTYIRPLLKTTDFWDVMPIAGARRVSKSRGVFVREFASLEDLKDDEKKGVYQNVDMLNRGTSGANPDEEWHKNLLNEIGMTNYQISGDDIEVIHYFSGGHVITFADRKVILRDSNRILQTPEAQQMIQGGVHPSTLQPFPYDMPMVQYKYMGVPLEFFAMGIPEILEVLQEDKNLIRSARRDNIDLVIQKIMMYREGSGINLDLIKYYPGAMWPVESMQDLLPVEIGDVTQSSYAEEGMREKDMENALSLFGYARGMTPQHTEQPTTVMKLQQASLNRLDLNVKLAEFGVIQNIATRMVMLTRRYMPQSVYESIVGDQDAGFYRLTEDDIRRFYHFKPVGSSITHIKELRQQQIQGAIDLVSKIPPQMMAMNIEPFTINWYEMLKESFDAIDIKGTDRILIKMNQEQAQGMNPMMGEGGQGQDMNQLAQVMYGGGQQNAI
jgi:hypothetical protein